MIVKICWISKYHQPL